MSLTIYLNKEDGTELVRANITHNLSKMWQEAGVYEALYKTDGKTASEVLQTLEQGLKEMRNDPERFRRCDSPNGWGTYKYALPWLEHLITEFKEFPSGIIEVST